MLKQLPMLCALLAVVVGVGAQDKKNDANVAGVWQLNVDGGHVIQVGMELKQDGEKLSGTILMPTRNFGQRREVPLTGTLIDDALTLSGEAENASDDTAKVSISGTLEKDGTMKGTLSAGSHQAAWTGQRLGR